jgi:type IV secretion system protein TrbL
MSSLRRLPLLLALAGLLAAVAVLAQPAPPAARANVGCDLATAPEGAVTEAAGAITGGLIGGGNPVGDACNTVTDPVMGAIPDPLSPLKSAAEGVGNSIFKQITSWVAEGTGWLMGKVIGAIEATSTPQLTTRGFVTQYGKMAAIAALLGMAMLLLAVLEGAAQGNATLLVRVALVNLPLAFIATSVAYVVVQLLLVATDGLCQAVTSASHHSSQHFFEGAIGGLGKAGGNAGKAVGGLGGAEPVGGTVGQVGGTVAVPLFVTFLAAIIGAFAAFFVWLELLMRDAAVYVVALFLPLALAASIWPRWSGALRRTAELLLVVISSKFVIVSILSLAAGLLATNDGQVEHILAAAALMLLACFAPFVLFKLLPFAEGAVGAAYGRRSASGGAVSGVQIASDVQILRNMSRSNWDGSGATLWSAEEGGGGRPGPRAGGGSGSGPGAPGGGGGGAGGSGAAGGEAAAAGGGAGAAVAVPAAAARGAQTASQRLAQSGVAEQAEDGSAGRGGGAGRAEAGEGEGAAARGTEAPTPGERPPRPPAEPKAGKPASEGKA